MNRSGYPLIERGLMTEVFVNGIYRIDNLGSAFHINYFKFAKDPDVNAGEIFRVPVLQLVWTREDFLQSAGSVRDWLQGGCGEIRPRAPMVRRNISEVQ